MSDNPINLALRFLLELGAVLAIAYWGLHQTTGALRTILAMALALVVAAVWGTFRVPDDPSASGRAPIRVPGPVRLLIELALFGFAVWALLNREATSLALALGGFVVVHYLVSYDRVLWLLGYENPG